MPLEPPKLDDRTFQDIVDDAKRKLQRLGFDWTDHNVSDPGVMLIELFAWMTDMLLFRLNRVPARNQIALLNLLGVRLEPPRAATTELTFRVRNPEVALAGGPLRVQAGTEVAARQRNGDAAQIRFSTDADLDIREPEFVYARRYGAADDQGSDLSDMFTKRVPIFSQQPKEGESFIIGSQVSLTGHVVALGFECTEAGGSGINPKRPPLQWEVSCGGAWERVDAVEDDGTGGFSHSGVFRLRLPLEMTASDSSQLWLIRCTHAPTPEQPRYQKSPEVCLNRSETHTVGATVKASHMVQIIDEMVGTSDGTPGQHFTLQRPPVVRASVRLGVESETGEWETWHLAPTEYFDASKPDDRHYLIDFAAGEVLFGPQIREPNGISRQYGAVPPHHKRIRVRYATTDVLAGNLPEKRLIELKRTIPGITDVSNHVRATGGTNAETVEHAAMRAAQELHTRDRAVTTADYEFLAREAARKRGLPEPRVHCDVATQPGLVRVLLVPNRGELIPHDLTTACAPSDKPDFALDPELVQAVKSYLEERRLLTTRFEVAEPKYVTVGATVDIRVRRDADLNEVQREACQRLHRFINPLVGGDVTGAIGSGWECGRALYRGELQLLLERITGVEAVIRIDLTQDDKQAPSGSIKLKPDQTLLSGAYAIKATHI